MSERRNIALVTGGGRSIGRSIALRLAHDGADVALLDLASEELTRTAEEIGSLGRRAVPIVVDVSREKDVASAVAGARESLGPIDVLVNNAAIIGPTAPAADVSLRDWDRVLTVNLTGPFLVCRAVTPEMIERRAGKVINIASVAGKQAYPLRSPYAASKWGLIGFTLTLAKELGPYSVCVNAICPGPVDGPRMDAISARRAEELKKSQEEVRADYIGATTLQRMVRQQDVASLTAFLASAEADNITGQAIDVSAGYAL